MTQAIDPIRLKAAAEHLDWVLRQYPDREDVQPIRAGLRRWIDDAREGRILAPVADSQAIPFRWAVSAEGLFRDYKDPDVGAAYAEFVTELEGGLSEQVVQIIADLEAPRDGDRA